MYLSPSSIPDLLKTISPLLSSTSQLVGDTLAGTFPIDNRYDEQLSMGAKITWIVPGKDPLVKLLETHIPSASISVVDSKQIQIVFRNNHLTASTTDSSESRARLAAQRILTICKGAKNWPPAAQYILRRAATQPDGLDELAKDLSFDLNNMFGIRDQSDAFKLQVQRIMQHDLHFAAVMLPIIEQLPPTPSLFQVVRSFLGNVFKRSPGEITGSIYFAITRF